MRRIPTRERTFNGKTFVLVSDYAKRFNISRQWVWQKIRDGYLPPDKVYRDEYSGLWWVCVE